MGGHNLLYLTIDIHRNQCDRLGDSFKFFGNNFFSQEKTKYVVTFGAILKYTILHGKIDLATFWATFGKIGLHCIPHLVTLIVTST